MKMNKYFVPTFLLYIMTIIKFNVFKQILKFQKINKKKVLYGNIKKNEHLRNKTKQNNTANILNSKCMHFIF